MNRIRLVSVLLMLTVISSILCGCFSTRDYTTEAEEICEIKVKNDEINKLIYFSDKVYCLVNTNEVRVYDQEGEILDSLILDSEAYDIMNLDDGFLSVLMTNGDILIIRSYMAEPLKVRFETHMDEKVIDISARDYPNSDTDLYWFLTSDNELYAAGINVNNSISEDSDTDEIFYEPVKIRDDFEGIYRYVGADLDGNLYNMVSWEQEKGFYLIYDDNLVSNNLQFTLYSAIKRIKKDNPKVLDDLYVGLNEAIYEKGGEFYYTGFAHSSKDGKPISVNEQQIDIPDGFNYALGLSTIVCYNEHKILIYKV